MDKDENAICILGGAATFGSRYAKMTRLVKDTFEKVWSVDPKFARGVENCVRARFQDVQLGNTNIFFSDIWDDTTALGNNHLSDVVSWFRRCVPSSRWHRLLLVYKLTWSTTNTVEMAKVIAEFKTFEFLRITTSKASTEYFLLLHNMTENSLITCCGVGARVNAIYAHAQSCENCLNGRLQMGDSRSFVNIEPWKDVKTNCTPDTGFSLWDESKRIFLRTGKHIGEYMGKKSADVHRTAEAFSSLWPRITSQNVQNYKQKSLVDQSPGLSKLELFMQRRTDENMFSVQEVASEGRTELHKDEGYAQHAQTWMHDSRLGLRLYGPVLEVPAIKVAFQQPANDAYLMAGKLLGGMAVAEDATWFASQLVKGTFGTGKLKPDETVAPTNARKHPVDTMEKYYAAGPGLGLHYSAKKTMQTLALMETRYLNIQKIFPFGWREIQLADEINSLWSDEHVRPNGGVSRFTDDDIELAIAAFLTDAKRKGYANRYVGTKADDSPEGRTVRFHLKTIFKPKVKMDVLKWARAYQLGWFRRCPCSVRFLGYCR